MACIISAAASATKTRIGVWCTLVMFFLPLLHTTCAYVNLCERHPSFWVDTKQVEARTYGDYRFLPDSVCHALLRVQLHKVNVAQPLQRTMREGLEPARCKFGIGPRYLDRETRLEQYIGRDGQAAFSANDVRIQGVELGLALEGISNIPREGFQVSLSMMSCAQLPIIPFSSLSGNFAFALMMTMIFWSSTKGAVATFEAVAETFASWTNMRSSFACTTVSGVSPNASVSFSAPCMVLPGRQPVNMFPTSSLLLQAATMLFGFAPRTILS